MPSTKRAEPLAPEDRRKAIIEAVIPLLLKQGGTVTTAQMADAAGIAEGTIFRVFPDKATLLHEAVRVSLDPEPVLTRLQEIDPGTNFETQMRQAASVLIERIQRIHSLIAVVRTLGSAGGGPKKGADKDARDANARIIAGLTRLFAGNAGQLKVPPETAAKAFNGMIFAAHFPIGDPRERITVDDGIEILLHGVLRHNVKKGQL